MGRERARLWWKTRILERLRQARRKGDHLASSSFQPEPQGVGAPFVGKDTEPAEHELERRTSACGGGGRRGDTILLFRGSLPEKPQGDVSLISVPETKNPRRAPASEHLLGSRYLP